MGECCGYVSKFATYIEGIGAGGARECPANGGGVWEGLWCRGFAA